MIIRKTKAFNMRRKTNNNISFIEKHDSLSEYLIHVEGILKKSNWSGTYSEIHRINRLNTIFSKFIDSDLRYTSIKYKHKRIIKFSSTYKCHKRTHKGPVKFMHTIRRKQWL